MTLDLDAIKARLAAATPGPWQAQHGDIWDTRDDGAPGIPLFRANRESRSWGRRYANDEAVANAEFLEHAPSDIAALVAEVERLTAVEASLRSSLIRACNATDGRCADQVSSEFLALVGAEVEACIGKLRSERDAARAAAIEECAAVADAWIQQMAGIPILHTSPAEFAVDAVSDVAENIRALSALTPAPARDAAVRAAALEEAGNAVEAATRAFYGHTGGFSESLDAAIRAGLATAIRALKEQP